MMPDREKVKYDIGRCICHVPDACRDCSHYKHGEYLDCMEELLKDALELLKEQEAVEPFHICTGKEYTLIEDSHFDYCPYCGKPIIWEGR